MEILLKIYYIIVISGKQLKLFSMSQARDNKEKINLTSQWESNP